VEAQRLIELKDSQEVVRWSGFQFQQETGTEVNEDWNEEPSNNKYAHLKDVILLDTGSSMIKATFMNEEMVTDIKKLDTPIKMTTNAENAMIGLEAKVPGNGHTWFDPKQIANVYGFSHMVNKYRSTYDSEKEDAFLVHTNEGIVRFSRTLDGLYAYKPSLKFKQQVADSKKRIRHEAS
jgi:hypothetical protein